MINRDVNDMLNGIVHHTLQPYVRYYFQFSRGRGGGQQDSSEGG